jgi:aminoglycoside phosphotransferase (APT) family kinase protein
MPLPRRDLELTHKQFVPWLRSQLPSTQDVRVSEFGGSGTTGFSNDTLLFELSWREDGREHTENLVLRIEPAGLRVFPEYDLGLQYGIMQALANTDVPVPRMLWRENDSAIMGNPFYVMERVEGRIPDDSPPYHTAGWMTEIAPEERASIWWSGIENLARIHRVDWRAVSVLPEPPAGKTPLEAQLDYYERYIAWAGLTEGGRFPLLEAALAWLRRQQPREREPVGVCWGDSRLGNMIFRDGRCVAVLDWEMATLGNPAQDLAWWLFFDEHHSAGVGAPRLSGLPERDETIARYRELSGIDPQHLDYYDLFACFRFTAILGRLGQQLKLHGVLPPESDFEVNNTSSKMLEARFARLGD